MDKSLVCLSRYISLVLRHEPRLAQLELDEQGWVQIDDLLNGAQKAGKRLTKELLLRIVRENDKQRFAISDDGQRIRANQGHTVAVDLGLAPIAPPARLYHGTVRRFLDDIFRKGICRGKRHHVHLSVDVETAARVGKRRGEPIILQVQSQQMHSDGYKFFCTENHVWLTEHVPPEYVSVHK
jgi:putative RNA 2'-phosphotransferase